jgi:putative membrane protein (TIGR04086 family)
MKKRLLFFLGFLLASYFVTGLLLLLLALLLYKFRLSGTFLSGGIILIYILSSFCGGFLAGKRIGHRKYLWGLLLGAAYFAVLALVSALVGQGISGAWNNFFITLFLCLASGMLGGMVS